MPNKDYADKGPSKAEEIAEKGGAPRVKGDPKFIKTETPNDHLKKLPQREGAE